MKDRHPISPFAVVIIFFVLTLTGLALLPLIPIKLRPSRQLPSITVDFRMNGTSARTVEMSVTSKLEAMLARLDGLQRISSTSATSQGRILLQFDRHTSMDIARLETSAIIRQAWPSLPESVSYPTISVNTPQEEDARAFLIYSLNAPQPTSEIQQYATDVFLPVIANLPGVYNVEAYGATPRAWYLEYDITQLDALGISADQIYNAIASYGQQITLGIVPLSEGSRGKRFTRLMVDFEKNKDDEFHPERIWLTSTDGKRIRLDQLVNVSRHEEEPASYYRINGLNSIYIAITAAQNANQMHVGKTVHAKMNQLTRSLPHSYEVHLICDDSMLVREELHRIYLRTALTVIILLVFAFLMTLNRRYLLLIVLGLYFNIATSFVFYYLFALEIQLYSLAGITISLSLIIDNTIIMADHYFHTRNRHVITAMIAATLTSVGALAMIFFLDEEIRLNLQDFAAVVIINLLVSLLVAWAFVPAAFELLYARHPSLRFYRRWPLCFPIKKAAWVNCLYRRLVIWMQFHRPISIAFLILCFGLPVFWLPQSLQKETAVAKVYNEIAAKTFVRKYVRPVLEKVLGGTLRLFVQEVPVGKYDAIEPGSVLHIMAQMPHGATMSQMNANIRQMEEHLMRQPQIRQIETHISSAQHADIRVLFSSEAENAGEPYIVYHGIVDKALQLGGGSWAVDGLPRQAFTNDMRENAGYMRIKMYGYNYDDLYTLADSFRYRLERNHRIEEVRINSFFAYFKDDYTEYVFDLDRQRIAAAGLYPDQLFLSLSPVFYKHIRAGSIPGPYQPETVFLSARQSRDYDLWGLLHLSRSFNQQIYRTNTFANITEAQMPQQIVKENQQYVLCLQYEYIGMPDQADRVLERELDDIRKLLPPGYSAINALGRTSSGSSRGGIGIPGEYRLILLIIGIVFFLSAILFNSLRQSLAVIFTIPPSYIGVFLTFYLFDFKFDIGGFAAFILLGGITVNSSIYIIHEYNDIRMRKPKLATLQAYIKAWNIKFIPIMLTVLSTMLGFLPFVIGTAQESFWFPFAVGTIGGLLFSVIGLYLYLPVFLLKMEK